MARISGVILVVVAAAGSACATSTAQETVETAEADSPPTVVTVLTQPSIDPSDAAAPNAPTTPPTTTTTAPPTTTTTTTAPPTTTTTTTAPPTTMPSTTPYVIPVERAAEAGWGDTHAAYPATDIFENGCGNAIVSPVNGALLEVRRTNSYDPNVDNPASRGGRSVAIVGDDGVRYYLAHFELLDDALTVGGRVMAGQFLGTIGTTGRSSACHVHFGISPPCPDKEWSVRRGVVWPYRYLDNWRDGGQLSPAEEVLAFVADNPNACATASTDQFAADA